MKYWMHITYFKFLLFTKIVFSLSFVTNIKIIKTNTSFVKRDSTYIRLYAKFFRMLNVIG